MEWNELEAIQHPEISLGASLEIYYPTWATPITIPNRVTLRELQKILKTVNKPINDRNDESDENKCHSTESGKPTPPP
jgi:hypothetical protein